MHPSHLSKRGIKASTSVIRTDMEAYFDAVQNLYHKDTNPDGAFPLNVAENKLCWQLLRDKIQQIARSKEIPAWVAGYTSGRGAPSFREAVAGFLADFLAHCPIDAERMVFSAGATSVIEMTALVLGDRDDVVAFPAPCYPVYRQDIGNIAGLQRFDIITHHELSALKDGLLMDTQILNQAKRDIENQGKNFRILVLTTPDNPTGGIYSREQLLDVTNWCVANKVHLIVNEIYALSLIDTSHPDIKGDYPSDTPFVSFLKIIEERKSPYLHWWYSFSKDFGISGFRVGVAYSHNEQFLAAYENLNYSHLVSNHTQWLLEEMLTDKAFLRQYIQVNQQRLTEVYVTVVKSLKKLQIDYVPSRGSLFLWIDLSRYLSQDTFEAEREFWSEFYQKTGILLTPGEGFGHTKRGLFRIVYPYFEVPDLRVAMKRMETFLMG